MVWTMPSGSGNFLLSTQPPSGYTDPVASNNTLVLPWQTIPQGSGQATASLKFLSNGRMRRK